MRFGVPLQTTCVFCVLRGTNMTEAVTEKSVASAKAREIVRETVFNKNIQI
jgi:hypothetical protein